jgi:CMP-N-acetylneuraminic acid synthetase
MTKNVVAVIPVRKGSQRVKNKNFKKFGNKNLLYHKIITLKKIKSLKKIVVNTDSKHAINLAHNMKVDYFKREKYYASNECTNSEFWKYIADTTDASYIMFTNCTSPLITVNTYNKILRIFRKLKNKYDSFNTVTRVNDYLYSNNRPLNFCPSKTPNSQNLKPMFKLNFAINIISKKKMSKLRSVIGKKPYLYEIDEYEGFDIDTKIQFDFANLLFKQKI